MAGPLSAREESVWEYPRPPRLEPVEARLEVRFADRVVAETTAGLRMLETSHPPVYYIPPGDVDMGLLDPAPGRSFCEFKGEAAYWDLVVGEARSARAAWSYPAPSATYAALKDFLAFYASRVDGCRVGDMDVAAQAGDFYGGWITPNIKGPFKGGPGTTGW